MRGSKISAFLFLQPLFFLSDIFTSCPAPPPPSPHPPSPSFQMKTTDILNFPIRTTDPPVCTCSDLPRRLTDSPAASGDGQFVMTAELVHMTPHPPTPPHPDGCQSRMACKQKQKRKKKKKNVLGDSACHTQIIIIMLPPPRGGLLVYVCSDLFQTAAGGRTGTPLAAILEDPGGSPFKSPAELQWELHWGGGGLHKAVM